MRDEEVELFPVVVVLLSEGYLKIPGTDKLVFSWESKEFMMSQVMHSKVAP